MILVQVVDAGLVIVVVLVRVLLPQPHVAHVERLVPPTLAHAALVVLRHSAVDVHSAAALVAAVEVETVADAVVAKCRPSTFLATLT